MVNIHLILALEIGNRTYAIGIKPFDWRIQHKGIVENNEAKMAQVWIGPLIITSGMAK